MARYVDAVRTLALVGAGIALVVDVVYLGIIEGQPGDGALSLRVPFVAAFIGLMAVASWIGARARMERYAPPLLALSGAGLFAMAAIALFSIGLAIMLAAVPVLIAAVAATARARSQRALVQALGGALVALAVFVVGIASTEIPVACPPTGFAAGSGPGLFRGPYHWSCANGVLTVGPGLCTQGGAMVDPNGHVTSTGGC